MKKSKFKFLRKMFTTYFPILICAIALVLLMYGMEILDHSTHDKYIQYYFFALGLSIVYLAIGKCIDDDFEHFTIRQEMSNLDKDIIHIDNQEIIVINSDDEFYRRLNKFRDGAKKMVQLTNLSPGNKGDSQEMEAYFKADFEYCKKNKDDGNFKFYRIFSIETLDKANWVRKIMEETKSYKNVSFAYVNVKNIEKSSPFPKMLNLQIIDEETVFIVNPIDGYMPPDFKPCFYLKDKNVAKIYSEYYNKVWGKLKEEGNQHGFLLKEGTVVHNDKLQKLIYKLSQEKNSSSCENYDKDELC